MIMPQNLMYEHGLGGKKSGCRDFSARLVTMRCSMVVLRDQNARGHLACGRPMHAMQCSETAVRMG